MTDWMELEKKYMMGTYARLPLVLGARQGCWVWDTRARSIWTWWPASPSTCWAMPIRCDRGVVPSRQDC